MTPNLLPVNANNVQLLCQQTGVTMTTINCQGHIQPYIYLLYFFHLLELENFTMLFLFLLTIRSYQTMNQTS